MRPAFRHGFWLGGALAGAMTASFGNFPRRDYTSSATPSRI